MKLTQAALIVISAGSLALVSAVQASGQPSCAGTPISKINGLLDGKLLGDGTIVGRATVSINIDGYGRAYHPKNAAANALIHLCNAGQVHLPDGSKYHGSVDNPTCTGRLMSDFQKIRAAGWTDASVGAIRWYGILARGRAKIAGRDVEGVIPIEQADATGFFVSPTALVDATVADTTDQSRYVNPLRISAAVIPNQPALKQHGVVMGSFGVAIDPQHDVAIPFVVGDFGPRVGEATPALARALAGLPVTDNVSRASRFTGHVDEGRVTWIFFGNAAPTVKYDRGDEQALNRSAKKAFNEWGGLARLQSCI
jgi:hypothetical protein